jgi:GNAT superfamily N-acetyltransferase
MSTLTTDVRLPFRRGPVEFTSATEADHESIYQTLLHVFHGPEREVYLGTLSEPVYRPEQRLLVKVDGRVASHVHLTERLIRFGEHTFPLQGVMWVGTLPEYRGHGFAQNLLRLASARARSKGVLVQTATTNLPAFYQSLGWAICGRHSLGKIPSRNLPTGGEGPPDPRAGAWHVRPWRQVELQDLMTLYDRQFATVHGSIVRSEEYWRWLIGRKLAHVIWVACVGERVHGYAFVKDHRVLEIATDPAHPFALQALLGRVRSEALERAYPHVTIHAPPEHPALEIVREVGGKVLEEEESEGAVSLYHVPHPEALVTSLLPDMLQRVRQAKLTLPLDLGLSVGDRKLLVHLINARSSRVDTDRLGRRHLTLGPAAFARLALGHTGIDVAMTVDGVTASTTTAVDLARVMFPRFALWRSPLDSVTA